MLELGMLLRAGILDRWTPYFVIPLVIAGVGAALSMVFVGTKRIMAERFTDKKKRSSIDRIVT